MPTLAETLVGSVLESSRQAPDLSAAITRGSQLAQTAQDLALKRQQIEQQKQEHMLAKADKIMNAVEKGSQFKDKSAQNLFFRNYVPGMVKALKMEEFFTPELMEYMQQSPEVRDKIIGLRLDIQNKINSGELRGQGIWDYARSKLSPEELPLLDTDSLLEQQKFATGEAGKAQRAETVAQATTERAREGRAAAGTVERAQQAAKSFDQYANEGGKATVQFNYKKLQDAFKNLDEGEVKTGKGIVKLIGGSDFAVDLLAPEVAEARDSIRSAIVGTLRPILGGAFAEREGQRILDLSFNPRLSTKENAKRVRAELDRIQEIVKSKEAEFVRQGFMSPEETTFGFDAQKEKPISSSAKGKREAGKAAEAPKKKFSDFSPAQQQVMINNVMKQTGKTEEEVKRMLEAR